MNANAPSIQLHDYQEYAKQYILTHPYCGLFLTMGTGKTSVTLSALYELNPNMHVLIIAPKTIARCTWNNEIKKWGFPFRTQSLIVNERGKDLSAKKRKSLYKDIPNQPPTLYFINRELVTDLVKSFPASKWPFGIVIIDESQSFKSHKAERFKQLKSARPYIFRLIELTGSPAPNGPMDLWSQIYLLDMGVRLERTITRYRETYFVPGLIANGYPVSWRPKYNAENCIYTRIKDITISIKNTNLNLPTLTIEEIKGIFTDAEKEIYNQMLKEFVLELPDGNVVEAANAAVLQAKLSQIASGAIYNETGSKEYTVIHKIKLELTEYLINDTEDNVLIAYYFNSDKEMLMNHFKEKKIEAKIFDGTPEMLDAWNKKQIPVLLIQPGSAGFGLNFQEGGATLIWYTMPWSLEQYEQTNARIYRQGQTQHTRIYHIIMKHTIDSKILSALKKKNINQQALLSAVNATLTEPIQ